MSIPIVDASTAYANNNDYYIYIRAHHFSENYKFKAFITSFEDKMEPSWSISDHMGAPPQPNYLNTKRTINLSFDVIAASLEEAIDNFNQCQGLLSSFYPTYAGTTPSTTTIASSPTHIIKFSNLISLANQSQVSTLEPTTQGVAGILFGASYKPELEAGVFEGYGAIYPKINKIDLSLLVMPGEEVIRRITPSAEELAQMNEEDAQGAAAFENAVNSSQIQASPADDVRGAINESRQNEVLSRTDTMTPSTNY